MPLQTLFIVEAFIFGLLIGSFLNVCIVRIPVGETLGGRSQCPQCKTKIRWHQNIPVLSFIILKGRCAYCRMKISWQYPIVEILTGVLSVLVLLKSDFELPSYLLWFLLFVAPLTAITFIDFKHQIIPDVISLPGILAGFAVTLYTFWPAWKPALLYSFFGVLAGGGSLLVLGQLYFLIRKREGMGGGDVKLSAMLGAFLGWKAIILVFLLSSILAVFYATSALITQRNREEGPMVIPYGPFLSAAALICFFYGDRLLYLYLHAAGLSR